MFYLIGTHHNEFKDVLVILFWHHWSHYSKQKSSKDTILSQTNIWSHKPRPVDEADWREIFNSQKLPETDGRNTKQCEEKKFESWKLVWEIFRKLRVNLRLFLKYVWLTHIVWDRSVHSRIFGWPDAFTCTHSDSHMFRDQTLK